jgi:hypothetical protein
VKSSRRRLALRYFCHYCNRSLWRATKQPKHNAKMAKNSDPGQATRINADEASPALPKRRFVN